MSEVATAAAGTRPRVVAMTGSVREGREQFDPEGRPTSPDGCNAAAQTTLDQLRRWARALRDARRAHPYES